MTNTDASTPRLPTPQDVGVEGMDLKRETWFGSDDRFEGYAEAMAYGSAATTSKGMGKMVHGGREQFNISCIFFFISLATESFVMNKALNILFGTYIGHIDVVLHAAYLFDSKLSRRGGGAPSSTAAANRGILYPVASSGRGFLPKAIRSQSAAAAADQIANQAGFPPRPALGGPPYSHTVRAFGFPHSDPHAHLIRPPHVHQTFLGSTGVISAGVKGVPISGQLKAATSQPSVSECNGYKDQRVASVQNVGQPISKLLSIFLLKVRIYEGSSLYALCRSWLRNGYPEEPQFRSRDSELCKKKTRFLRSDCGGSSAREESCPLWRVYQPEPPQIQGSTACHEQQVQDALGRASQPQYVDGVKLLPKPSPSLVVDALIKKEAGEEEEERSVENLSSQDLLQRHVKRAKRVRAQLDLRSLVLELSEYLRVTGFALILWTNAWRALDAVGTGSAFMLFILNGALQQSGRSICS
ncbi:hypothetical protein RHSIM_Rhsim06G0015600 [Rhododendron simsii]|uniref:Uncharacterized protein n=1 Tax=Rhododendron simsii TaxID=118357 RepID=A0A834GQJ0_RHOSS|nr:hypothetical protein RHSIM_Rhsim06G0015600 [Rhododendron simsii]